MTDKTPNRASAFVRQPHSAGWMAHKSVDGSIIIDDGECAHCKHIGDLGHYECPARLRDALETATVALYQERLARKGIHPSRLTGTPSGPAATVTRSNTVSGFGGSNE